MLDQVLENLLSDTEQELKESLKNSIIGSKYAGFFEQYTEQLADLVQRKRIKELKKGDIKSFWREIEGSSVIPYSSFKHYIGFLADPQKYKEQLECKKKYNEENKEERLEYEKKRYKKNREEILECNKKWREEHPEYNREYYEQQRVEENERRWALGLPRVGEGYSREAEMRCFLDRLLPGEKCFDNRRWREIGGHLENSFGLELDRYYPKLKIAFEHDGVQHFEYIPYLHKTEEGFLEYKKNDRETDEMCQKAGITLIRIRYDEELSKGAILEKLDKAGVDLDKINYSSLDDYVKG